MDPSLRDYYEVINGIRLQSFNDSRVGSNFTTGLSNLGNGYADPNSGRVYNHYDPTDPIPSNLPPISSASHFENLQEDYDFSDSVLRYINQILMEEDLEGKTCMLQESLEHQALEDAEKSFYEVIGERYPPQLDLGSYAKLNLDSNPNRNPSCICPSSENLNCYFPDTYHRFGIENGIDGSDGLTLFPSGDHGTGEFCGSEIEDNTLPSFHTSISSYSSISVNNVTGVDGLIDSPISTLQSFDLYNESQSITQFIKGVEEASKFLPDSRELVVSVDTAALLKNHEEQFDDSSLRPVLKEGKGDYSSGSPGKKHSFEDGVELEAERTAKQAAIYHESDVRSDMFDRVLLFQAGDKNELLVSLRTTLQTEATKRTEQSGKLSGGAKGRGKKQGGRKEVVDLRTLLVNCAQAVAANDRSTVIEFLKQIREHSSCSGDGNQRLAYYVADALEARLSGTGSQVYKALTSKRTTAADVLKAYLLYLAACPFRKLSNFFSNKSIAKRTRKAPTIHIIDFGILYGFQWPTFIQRQSMREGGPPKIRITGIDFPQPGFRPAERVQKTGRRLENYAQEFKVPFEYHAIAKRWDAIQPEDFDIDEEDVLIVNCIYRMKNLPDETVSVESSRNIVLKMIRKLNPDVFIHGVVNGSYNAPFFLTRFREALFHFSAQFDMLETIVPREYNERMLIERDLLAREALNVIACEGWERVERPETYRQWQIRTVRAGFTQLPLDAEIKQRAMQHVHSAYHKDFVIDEDSKWLLLGWKGRITFALSTWQPT